MQSLINKHEIKEYWGGQANHFLDLVEIITGQQLSIKAADTIFKRFLALFDANPDPHQILALPTDQLRSVGFSNSKAAYVLQLARAVEEGSLNLNLDYLNGLTDEQITHQLTSIKGLGPWSAEMFLIFSLKRPDIFSVGDLGLRTAISRLYGLDREDKPAILQLSETWRPYRTSASRYLWASLDAV